MICNMYNAYVGFETVWALDYQPFAEINHDNQRWLIQPIDGFKLFVSFECDSYPLAASRISTMKWVYHTREALISPYEV